MIDSQCARSTWGGVRRYAEMWGGMGRYREMQANALAVGEMYRHAHAGDADAEGPLEDLGRLLDLRYRRDMGEMWARYGRDMGEIWARYKGRYGRDIGEI